MGQIRNPDPSLLIVACFSRHMDALDWARAQLEKTYGPVALASPDFDFHHTKYYLTTMGPDLKKRFLAFERLVDSGALPDLKLHANQIEQDLAAQNKYPESRPLNLDPGLLQLGKFLLASTKDQAHRIYLRDGIFAEVTLFFRDGAFEPWPWTYADYREDYVRSFLKEARELLRSKRA
ncbi:MAG: DUF4416 family protein [Gemmataceae bacterium]|nr:DUF4416 family protein [Gemmataceae bacterium]MCI0741398.1 DUF4416 family protein [Gemmataceae bacterium]